MDKEDVKMSHLTTLDVKLDNFEALKKAVVDMGFTYDATEHVMHTNYGQSEKVALQILSKQGKRIPLASIRMQMVHTPSGLTGGTFLFSRNSSARTLKPTTPRIR
jgi:hypothetical protein